MTTMTKITRTFFGQFLMIAALLTGILSGGVQAAETDSWLGLPVTYIDDGITFHPWPGHGLRDVKVHTPDPILIAKAWVTPDWGGWISGKTNRIRIEAEQIIARPSSLLRLGSAEGKSTKKITGVRFNSLKLLLGNTSITLPAGEIEFAEDGTMSHLRTAIEQFAKFDVSPAAGKLTVLMNTAVWNWDVLHALHFDGLVAQGEIADDHILFDKIGGTADGGSADGVVQIAVTDSFAAAGEIALDKMDVPVLFKFFFPNQPVQGMISSKFKFSTAAPTLAELGKKVVTSGSFSIKSGSIDRFGLLEGLRREGSGVVGGGLVKFTALEGSFSGGVGKPTSVSISRLDGGAMQANGSFVIKDDATVKGSMNASIRLPSGENKSRTMLIDGEVKAPQLKIP